MQSPGFFTKFIIIFAAFIVAYFILFFLIQIVFFKGTGFYAMFSMLHATGREAALINMPSLLLAVIASVAAFLWMNKAQSKRRVKSKRKIGKK